MSVESKAKRKADRAAAKAAAAEAAGETVQPEKPKAAAKRTARKK